MSILLEKKSHNLSFMQITSRFPVLLKTIKDQRRYLIKDYFQIGSGVKSVFKRMNIDDDFEGLYIFFKNKIPFYTGISKHVIKRINQHIKGKNHFSSSSCYKIGSSLFLDEHTHKHSGGRAGLDFAKYVEPAKTELMECEFTFIKFQMI